MKKSLYIVGILVAVVSLTGFFISKKNKGINVSSPTRTQAIDTRFNREVTNPRVVIEESTSSQNILSVSQTFFEGDLVELAVNYKVDGELGYKTAIIDLDLNSSSTAGTIRQYTETFLLNLIGEDF